MISAPGLTLTSTTSPSGGAISAAALVTTAAVASGSGISSAGLTRAGLRASGTGPTFQGQANQARSAGTGPTFQGTADELRQAGTGPTFQGVADEFRQAGTGPTFQGRADEARAFGTGPTFQGEADLLITAPPALPPYPPAPPPPPAPAPDLPGPDPIPTTPLSNGPFPPELSNKPRTSRLQPPRNRDPRAFGAREGRFSGPAFPFGPTPQGVFGLKDDVLVVATSIVNILSTPKESMPYDPEIGSQVPYLLFEVLDDVTLMVIRQFAAKEVSEQEPRVIVVSVDTDADIDGLTVFISLGWQIAGDPLERTYNTPVDLPRLLA